MLVLTRRTQESVVVGGCDGSARALKVTVLRVRGGVVRLGFEGPDQIAVHRLEVWERIRAGVGSDRPYTPRRPVHQAATSRDVRGDLAPLKFDSTKGT